MKPQTVVFDKEAVDAALEVLGRAEGWNPDADPNSGRVALAYPVDSKRVIKAVRSTIGQYADETGIFIAELDDVSVIKYEAGGICKRHSDVSVFDRVKTHKVSLVVQLSEPDEYEGGQLTLFDNGTAYAVKKQKGLALLFPSWMYHQVDEVTGGTRLSLVAWANGPVWR